MSKIHIEEQAKMIFTAFLKIYRGFSVYVLCPHIYMRLLDICKVAGNIIYNFLIEDISISLIHLKFFLIVNLQRLY